MTNNMQQNRLLKTTISGFDESFVTLNFTGTEALSCQYHWQVTLVSESSIDPNDILNKPTAVEISQKGQTVRNFHGYINQIESDPSTNTYHLNLVPITWYLSQNSQCRIFQEKSTLDIVSEIFRAHHISNFDYSKLAQTYPTLPYRTQFNESDFHFISRLLEEAGIYYYFSFDRAGHQLHLVDDLSQLPKTSQTVIHRHIAHNKQHLHQWRRTQKIRVNQFHSRDYDLLSPQQMVDQQQATRSTSITPRFRYNFPRYQSSINTTKQDAWQSQQFNAAGNYPSFCAGLRFFLAEHEDPMQQADYYLTEVTHTAHDYSRFAQPKDDNTPVQYYRNDIKVVPVTQPYTPALKHPRPQMAGNDYGLVTGPQQTTIYRDDYGRVKVAFHWDRHGPKNDQSSCWLRCMQMVAGDDWGSQFIPRVGQQAIVHYINGDPDRPVVIGTLANEEKPPSFDPGADGKYKHGFTSQSLDPNNNTRQEFSLNDHPGQEQFTIASARNLKLTASKALTQVTGHGDTSHIEQNQIIQALSGEVNLKAKRIILTVGNSQITIGDEGIVINSPQTYFGGQGVGDTKAFARLGDHHKCSKIMNLYPHIGGAIKRGSPNVFVNNKPLARVGDKAHCLLETDHIKHGAAPILINGHPVARLNGHTKHGGVITKASPNVAGGEYAASNQSAPPRTC